MKVSISTSTSCPWTRERDTGECQRKSTWFWIVLRVCKSKKRKINQMLTHSTKSKKRTKSFKSSWSRPKKAGTKQRETSKQRRNSTKTSLTPWRKEWEHKTKICLSTGWSFRRASPLTKMSLWNKRLKFLPKITLLRCTWVVNLTNNVTLKCETWKKFTTH